MSSVSFTDKINDTDSKLIADLIKVSKNSPKLVKSSLYVAPEDHNIMLTSWKMNEFKYHDVPSPFPTLARGLFTQEVRSNKGKEKEYRIVARGYDKFFNIGEVPWTTWASLEENTEAPYTLTLKSNGCIIFIAALTPTKIVVTSKHALGSVNGVSESHSQVGERWLKKHLADAGKTVEELAAVLWEKDWTAVAELCDDSFEEHVLPYAQDKTGLHLHGLNTCTKQFKTMLPDAVESFAREWGFIVTPSITLDTIPEVKSFTEEIGKTGVWNGEALEGFVVRTHIGPGSVSPNHSKSASASPYKQGSSFFFKVKFDEPYMMYRDWREVTKALLSKGPLVSNVPKSKMRREETKVYVQWVIEEIQRDKSQFALYSKGKGIIATRERFLRWLESGEGQKRVGEVKAPREEKGKQAKQKASGKTIIVPVAIPGVGKTSIAVALAHLFGFGHTQSDDIKAKKPAPVFIQNVTTLLKKHDVVIADKNNHLRQHRRQLREINRKFATNVRLIALNWSFDIPKSTIHRICSERVLTRGENHQSLRPDGSTSYENVLWMFLNTAEELTPDEVDVVIEMDVEEDLGDALKRAVDACVEELGVERPDAEKMGEALAIARGYTPKIKQQKTQERKGGSEPRYFALLPEVDVDELVEGVMRDGGPGKEFWDDLVREARTKERPPHVTVVHTKAKNEEGNQVVWAMCKEVDKVSPSPIFKIRLGHLVWDERVMALTVEDLSVVPGDSETEEESEAARFVKKLPDEIKEKLHVTVGTRTRDIPPVEARDLVAKWKEGKTEGVHSRALDNVWVQGRLRGLFK